MADRPNKHKSSSKKKSGWAKKKNKRKAFGFPSDAAIIDFVNNSPGKIGKNQVARHFKLTGDHRIALKDALLRLRETGKLRVEDRKIVTPTSLPKVCVMRITGTDEDGELQAEVVKWDDENGKPPAVLIKAENERLKGPKQKAIGVGDIVLARPVPITDDKYDYMATIVKRLDQEKPYALGVIRQMSKGFRITPTDKKSRFEFVVASSDERGLKDGQLVGFEVARGSTHGLKIARIVKRLGNIQEQKNISLVALAEHEIPVDMPEAVENTANALKEISPKGTNHHNDLRHVPLITIDPPDARDHDDAIFAQADDDKENLGGVNIIVAIADVAYYVKSKSLIDNEARKRGNSTYLPDRVVPMLPERLSTDLCSLKEKVDRPALACFMTFDKKGNKLRHYFDRIIMCSAAKLSYQEAQDAIDGKEDAIGGVVSQELYDDVLKPLWAAYAVLKKGRSKRQPLELDLPERKLVIGESGVVEDVKIVDRFDAHKLVEEFMIQANVAAAETLEDKKRTFIYRSHDAPSAEKLVALADFLKTLDLTAPTGQVMKPANFNSILEKVKDTELEHVINQVVLRSQSQAVYTTDNLGHFGLNLRRYAHFTSPIRRYADFTVHRGLISALGLGGDGSTKEEESNLHTIAEEISVTERRSMLAERDTKDRMIANFLSGEINKIFDGRIAGMAGAGLFIALDETGADGFIPAATLGNDYFIYDEEKRAMVGERTGETFTMGDKVSVRLLEAVPVSGGLKLEMISDGKKGKPAGRSKGRGSRSGQRSGQLSGEASGKPSSGYGGRPAGKSNFKKGRGRR